MIRAKRVVTGLTVAGVMLSIGAVDVLTATRYATSAVIVLMLVRALMEAYALLRAGGIACHATLGTLVLLGVLAVRAACDPLGLTAEEGRSVVAIGIGLASLGTFVLAVAREQPAEGPQPRDLVRAAATALPLAWIGLLGGFLLELRLLPGQALHGVDRGLALVLVVAASVKLGDSAAYFVGRAIGRRPLTWVSPKKTWEGALASVIGSVAVAVLLGTWFGFPDTRLMAGLGLVANLSGQGGDLVESYAKRAVGAKDSATTFGEIGGVLDMLDALLVAAPFAYLYVQLLILRGGAP